MMPEPIITTHNLNFSFGRFQALKNINLEVHRNSIFGFLGPNGAGKTTMIKAILGLLKTSRHSIKIFSRELSHHKLSILSRVGAMVESPSLYPALSGFENVEIIRILRGLPRNESQRVLQTVSLSGDARRPVSQYSTGMKQRLALAIALLDKPELLVLDEPMNGLDPSGIIEIREFLLHLNRQFGITIFLSSHILSEIEKLATHIGIIDKGNLKFQGTFDELQMDVMGNRRVFFRTDDDDLASERLKITGKIIEKQNHGFYFFAADQNDIAEAIRIMVNSQLQVFEAAPESNDLEDLFINIIKTGD
ncbi:MAG: ATP-binding cassette domain-containing protein [Bacteroidales bacterium]|nr:ATP-binding cassette domain-containing protein [Bacteroidales bacterium]